MSACSSGSGSSATSTSGAASSSGAAATGAAATSAAGTSAAGPSSSGASSGTASAAATNGASPGATAATTNAGALTFPASTTAALQQPCNLTFWSWVPRIEQNVAMFEKAYPKIKVKYVNAGQGAAQYTALRNALKANKGVPDVVQVEYQYIPSFTTTNSLLDITQYLPTDFGSRFVDWAWKGVGSNGKTYAVPQDTGPMGMLYREDLLKKYNIPVPTTWDEFATAAHTLHAADPKAYLTNMPQGDAGLFNALLWQAGARPFSQASSTSVKINANSPEAQKFVAYWEKLIKAGDVSTDADFNTDWNSGFNTGKYATWITAGWGLDSLRTGAPKTTGLWRAAPMPSWVAGKAVGANWGGSSDAVTKATKCPAAATALAAYINASPDSANNLAFDKVLFPPVKAVLADPKYSAQKLAFYGNTTPVKVFADASTTVATDFQYSPFQDYAYAQLNTDVGAQFTKTGDPVAGLAKWQSDLESFAKKNGFTLEK